MAGLSGLRTENRKSRRASAIDILDRAFGIVAVVLAPGGPRALRTWTPRSAAAFRITRAVGSCGVTPAMIIDVGANIGQFSRASLGRWPTSQIIAFEPLPSAAESLGLMLTSMGDCHAVHQMALGSRNGETVFRQHRYSLSSSVLPVAESSRNRYEWAKGAESIAVPMGRLDDVLVGVPLVRPLLIKIDVQGYEMEVLSGAKRVLEEADCLVVEHAFDDFYEGQSRAAEVIEYLMSSGWEFDRVVDIRREGGVIAEADVVYLRQGVRTRHSQR